MTQGQKEKIFASGMYFDKREGSPVYVIGSLSLKVSELIPFLQQHEKVSGYVNVDVKQAKSGKYYCELNTWVPTQDKVSEKESNQTKDIHVEIDIRNPEEDINPEEIPF